MITQYTRSICSILCACATLLALGYSRSGRADEARFIRTHTGVHQSVDGTVQVINAEANEVAGIFIRVGAPIDPQSFTPAEIDPSNSETLFIKYDTRNNRYDELYLGARVIKIVGSFSLTIGPVRLAVDNLNPYISVVLGNAVIGFLGTGLIVNNDKAALLEANQFSNYRDIVKPYLLSKGEISLNGKPLRLDVLGLNLEQPKNPCLPGGDAVYLKSVDLDKIRRAKKGDRSALLEAALKKSSSPFLSGTLIIQIQERGAIVGINYKEGNVQQISKLSSKSFPQKTVCIVENLPLR